MSGYSQLTQTKPPNLALRPQEGGLSFCVCLNAYVASVGKLEKHIHRLCQENGIRRIVKPGRGRARVAMRVIRHPPLGQDPMAYFVALHEIGHVVIGLTGTRLEREALAWQYALDNSIIPVHYSIRQRICACLIRYLARANQAGWKQPVRGDLYWDLVAWWRPLVDGSTIEPEDDTEDAKTD